MRSLLFTVYGFFSSRPGQIVVLIPFAINVKYKYVCWMK